MTPAQPSVAAESDNARTPLRVRVETLAPAVIPSTGRVTLTGVVTNRSRQTWTDLNVYMLTAADPIQSRGALAKQAATSANAAVGGRVTTEGLYDQVGDLAPGQSASYRVSVPREDM